MHLPFKQDTVGSNPTTLTKFLIDNSLFLVYNIYIQGKKKEKNKYAPVVEMVDTGDLKSPAGNSVPVRVRSGVPLSQ